MKIMGILNVTPDSFSDGGSYIDLDSARNQVAKMISEGADIIDVGGESTRPGAQFVTSEEEIKRVVPVIEMIKSEFNIIVSIDTYKSDVAKAAVIAGADIINDVQANAYDGGMLDVAKAYDVLYIAMHSRKKEEPISDIENLFDQILSEAEGLGIVDKIILDPGIGFNKDINANLLILNKLKQTRDKYPNNQFLLGTSRKRFIGTINNVEDAKDRVIGTTVTSVVGYQAGYDYVRVHDVLANKQAIEMIAAIETHV